jgi:triosephosphate isomerase
MTNKLKYFIANWKMFGDLKSINILNRVNTFLIKNLKYSKNTNVIFCVPHTLIYFLANTFKKKSLLIGTQNCHSNRTDGSYTGSINAKMIKNSGAKYIILGHSENRREGETNKIIRQKIDSALNQKLKIILCIGESLREKKSKKTFSIIKKQIKDSLSKKFKLNNIILAYEPIWSIGTGRVPKSNELQKTLKFIKENFRKLFKTRNFPKVLYGGSVSPKNVISFSRINEIDGFLIGKDSRSSKKFIDIIKNYYK